MKYTKNHLDSLGLKKKNQYNVVHKMSLPLKHEHNICLCTDESEQNDRKRKPYKMDYRLCIWRKYYLQKTLKLKRDKNLVFQKEQVNYSSLY